MTVLTYTPPPSLEPFLVSDKFISLVIGPVGSTKTTAGILKIAYEAARVKACRDGIRRSRAIWIRQTREQLRDTSIPDFLRWYPDGEAGIFEKTNYRFVLKWADVECEVLFRGLDDANDIRRLLSLQATFGIADEFRELHMDIFNTLQGRLGRYPSKADNGVGAQDDFGNQIDKFWGMSNPPDFDTPWEHYLNNPPENAEVFFQPSGLSEEADWLQYLKDDYYSNLIEGKEQNWIDIYVHGKFGASLSGKPVYPSFKADFHIAKQELKPFRSEMHPLIIGMDFGLDCSATINQLDPRGRFLTYAALPGKSIGVVRFINTILKPALATPRFSGFPVIVIGDPAGVARVQTNEATVYEELRKAGYKALPARTNLIAPRIASVEGLLNRQIDGGAARLICPTAKDLIRVYRGGYRYRTKNNGETEDKPEKNELSHLADADQYACLHADGGLRGGEANSARREVKVASAAGWT